MTTVSARSNGPLEAVGDVTTELQTAAATLVFAAQAQNFQTVTWHHVQGRLRPGQNQKVMVALDVFRQAGVLTQIERMVPAETAPGNPPAPHGPQPKRRRLAPAQPPAALQMTTTFSEPVVAVKRGGQDSFPSFTVLPITDWPADNAVLAAIKAEFFRRDAMRRPGA